MPDNDGFHLEDVPAFSPSDSIERYAHSTVFKGSTPDYSITIKMSLRGKLVQVQFGYDVFETEGKRRLEKDFTRLINKMLRRSRTAIRVAARESRS